MKPRSTCEAAAVLGERLPGTAVTDADGRYFIPLASGVYTLVVDGRQEVAGVEVEVGVKRRVDVVVTGA